MSQRIPSYGIQVIGHLQQIFYPKAQRDDDVHNIYVH